MDAQQGKWVVYHLHGETSLSMVCGNGRQKKKRFGNLPFTQKKKQICQNRPYDNEFNLIIISRCHEELQMVNTFSTWKFGLTILDYLSRHSIYFKNFPAGQSNHD